MCVMVVVGVAPCHCLTPAGIKTTVSLANHLNRAAPLLNQADTICHDQNLAKRMGVPGRSRSGLERDLTTARPGWFLRIEKRLNANRAREAIRSACDDLLRARW